MQREQQWLSSQKEWINNFACPLNKFSFCISSANTEFSARYVSERSERILNWIVELFLKETRDKREATRPSI
jgi:hypothetical protein